MILLLPLTFVKTNLNTFKSGVISKDGKPLMGLQLPDSWFLEPAVIPIDVRGDSLAMAWTPDGQILADVTGLESSLWKFQMDRSQPLPRQWLFAGGRSPTSPNCHRRPEAGGFGAFRDLAASRPRDGSPKRSWPAKTDPANFPNVTSGSTCRRYVASMNGENPTHPPSGA